MIAHFPLPKTSGLQPEVFRVPDRAAFNLVAAAKYIGTSPSTLRKYADLGIIKYYRRERIRYFTLEDLDAFRVTDINL